jgi:hypothetical protein
MAGWLAVDCRMDSMPRGTLVVPRARSRSGNARMTSLDPPGSHAEALVERLRFLHERIGPSRGRGDQERSAEQMRALAPLPTSAGEMAQLLDACFFATLLTEEGRPTRFSCAFIGPDSLDGISARRLARPLPLTPEVIRRIAPAIDPLLTSLGVHSTGDGLCIWGLVDAPRLRALQVFGSDTGVLRVSYVRQTQLTYAHGVGRVRAEKDPSFLTSIQLIGAAMGLVTPQWYRPRALLGLADELIRDGHGGAILVSKRPHEEVRRGRISLTYPSLGPLTTLEEPVLEAQEANPAGSPDDDLFQEFKSVERRNDIRRTARLGAIDGAVLCDPHLRVVGFGAMIDVKGTRGQGQAFRVELPAVMAHLAERPSGLSQVSARQEVRVEEVGGQRHQSAIRWCSTSRAALLALVCSQDGAASIVAPMGVDGDVGVVQNIETSPDNW